MILHAPKVVRGRTVETEPWAASARRGPKVWPELKVSKGYPEYKDRRALKAPAGLPDLRDRKDFKEWPAPPERMVPMVREGEPVLRGLRARPDRKG